jgi:hypothetical protein
METTFFVLLVPQMLVGSYQEIQSFNLSAKMILPLPQGLLSLNKKIKRISWHREELRSKWNEFVS